MVDGLEVEKLWYVPGAGRTLISVSGLVERGYTIVADMVVGRNMMLVMKGGMTVMGMEAHNGVYFIPTGGTGW